jgi:hypothetical protein
MTTATELLRRVLEVLDDRAYTPEWYQVKQDIRAFLAAEPEAEPVAWIIETEMMDGSLSKRVSMDRKRHKEHHDSLSPIIPLYTRPEPARKPMTDREIMEQAKAMGFDDLNTIDFAIGVRYAEKRLGVLEKHCGL